jgi:hypothetical protein
LSIWDRRLEYALVQFCPFGVFLGKWRLASNAVVGARWLVGNGAKKSWAHFLSQR